MRSAARHGVGETRPRSARLAAPLLGVMLGLLAGACVSFPAPRQPFTDPERAIALQGASRERLRSIRAEARIDQRGDQGRIKGTVLMFVERPGRVRFDAMTQFGPVAVLTSDGQSFAYADLRSKRFTTGATCPRNIARLLNVPLTVEQTTRLLLGGTPVIDHEASAIEWHDDGFYRVTLRGGGRKQEIDLAIPEQHAALPPEQQELRLVRSEIYDVTGKTDWRATYGDYRHLSLGSERVPVPFEVRVEQPSAGIDTLIRFKQIALNAEIPAEAFTQTPLPGMTQEVAGCE